MNKIILFVFLVFSIRVFGQTTWGDSLTVQLQATVQVTPPQITLLWNADADADTYKIYRKYFSDNSWDLLDEIDGSATTYTDADVAVNTLYDYKTYMQSSGTPAKYGYVTSGIEVKHDINKGICILVCESSFISETDFSEAYSIFKNDISADGWFVREIFVNADDSVPDVKAQIISMYNEHPEITHSLVLLGHVPVPYSGNLNPDGHPDHQGAWPTDMFYADVEGEWTDATVNSTVSGNTKNHNIPSDGKFDQSYLPGDVVLQTGRIDFFDMPSFEKTEKELLIAYMQKNHAFKTKQFSMHDNGIVDDNFLGYTEGFSQNAYRNFAPLLSAENILLNDYFTEMSYYTGSGESYLWSYGCGGGWYQGAGGIGDTYAFTIDSLNTVFTMLFGSYFGDWDNTDNFLRAALAQGNTLTNCWAGRPNWHFYAMGMGKNIGYCTQLTQNNSSLFYPSTLGGLSKMVSINLLGDPTLRMHYVTPPSDLVVYYSLSGSSIPSFDWTPSPDESVIGYNLYRKNIDSIFYEKRNSTLLTTTYFDESGEEFGDFTYLLTAVELKTTPSGTYYNESLGILQDVSISAGVSDASMFEFSIFPNPVDEKISISLKHLNDANFVISNVHHQKIISGKISSEIYQVNVSMLPPGIYYLQVVSDGKTAVKKFVKK